MILTLPVTPRSVAPIGYRSTVLIGDMLSRRMEERYLIPIGKLGKREVGNDLVSEFKSGLEFLQVRAETWLDADRAAELDCFVQEFLKRSELREVIEDCFICECQALEIPKNQVEFLKEKTFSFKDGRVCCLCCGKLSKVASLKRLYVFWKDSSVDFIRRNLFFAPNFYWKEINGLYEQILKNGICISRERETGFVYGDSNLDVELVWQCLLCLFSQEKKIFLVANNHVLRQVLLSVGIFRSFGFENEIQILVPPYIKHPGNLEKWQLTKLKSLGYDNVILRLMLATSLHWKSKDVILRDDVSSVDYRRLSLLKILSGADPQGSGGVTDFISVINSENAILGLKHVFNKDKFDYQKLFGLFA